jgi:lysophospholipase L1-like esterase
MKMKTILTLALFSLFSAVLASNYNILDFGAEPGKLSTRALQEAVDACHEAGGGTVLVPAGKYLTGTIVLKSYVNLHLESGAILEASLNLDDYSSSFRKHGMIFCEDAEFVSITGNGIIQARGIEFYDPTQNHVYEEFLKERTRQKEGYMPAGSFYSDGPIKRKPKPGMTLQFYHCSNVKLKDFTLYDTPEWAIRLGYCDDVEVAGISIHNHLMIPNSDGIHLTTSRNVRISNCDIRAGDDAFVVTGFTIAENTPGIDTGLQDSKEFGNKTLYAENVVVSNCNFQSRSSGIRVGYGQHPIRNCTFDNIVIYGSNRGIGVFARDDADIENLIFSNIIIQTRLHNGQWWGNGEPIHLSTISRFEGHEAGNIRSVTFSNIQATSEHGIILYGDGERSIENIAFSQVDLTIKAGKETLAYGGNFDLRPAAEIEKQLFKHDIPGLYALNVDGLSISDFRLTWGKDLPDYFTYAIETEAVKDLELHNFRGEANPTSGLEDIIKERPARPNIVMLGNSITYSGQWAELLNRKDVFNGGKPGWTTQQISWVIKNFVIPNEPVLCFFMGGINDYTLGIPTKRIYENICLNLDSIHKVGTTPVFQTTLYQRGNTRVNREIDKLNKKVMQYCREKGYEVVDLRPFLCEQGDLKKEFVRPDNTHLNPIAYTEWVKAIRPVLEKYDLE